MFVLPVLSWELRFLVQCNTLKVLHNSGALTLQLYKCQHIPMQLLSFCFPFSIECTFLAEFPPPDFVSPRRAKENTRQCALLPAPTGARSRAHNKNKICPAFFIIFFFAGCRVLSFVSFYLKQSFAWQAERIDLKMRKINRTAFFFLFHRRNRWDGWEKVACLSQQSVSCQEQSEGVRSENKLYGRNRIGGIAVRLRISVWTSLF